MAESSSLESAGDKHQRLSRLALHASLSMWVAGVGSREFKRVASIRSSLHPSTRRMVEEFEAFTEGLEDFVDVAGGVEVYGSPELRALVDGAARDEIATRPIDAILAELATLEECRQTALFAADLRDLADAVTRGDIWERQELFAGFEAFKARSLVAPAGLNGSGPATPFFQEQWILRAPLEAKSPKWAIVELVYQESLLILGGDVGSGKTTAALQMALSVLTGIPFLGKACALRGPVVLIEEEMGEGSLKHSLQALAVGHSLELDGKLEFPFHSRCRQGIDLQDPGQASILLEATCALKPALTIVDSATAVHTGGNNDPKDLQPLLEFCLKTRDRTKGVVLLIDHVVKLERKGRADRQNQTRPAHLEISGSHAKVARADQVIVLYAPQDQRRQMIFAKNRLGKDLPPLWVKIEGEDIEGATWKRMVITGPPHEQATDEMEEIAKQFIVILATLGPLDYISASECGRRCGVQDKNVPSRVMELLQDRGQVVDDGKKRPKFRMSVRTSTDTDDIASTMSAMSVPTGLTDTDIAGRHIVAPDMGKIPHPQARNVSARQPGDDRPEDF